METLFVRLRRSIRSRQFISAFFARIASSVLGFSALLGASRLLDGYEYGVYVFLFSIGCGLGVIFTFGQQNLVLKRFRVICANDDKNVALLRFNIIWLLLSFGFLSGACVAIWSVAPLLPEPYDRMYLAGAFAAAYALSEYLQSYFRVQGSIWLALLPREVFWRGATAGLFVVASVLGIGHSATTAMYLAIALLFLAVSVQICEFLRQFDLKLLFGREKSEHYKPWRTESSFFAANNILTALVAYFETVVVGAVLGMEQAALYFVALRYATLLLLPSTAIDTVGLPLLAARFQADDRVGAQRLIAILAPVSFLISAAGGIAMAAGGTYALALFKPDFAGGTDVLLVLCLSSVINSFFGPGVWLLVIGGGERFNLASSAVIFSFYTIILYSLTTKVGMVGAAFSNLMLVLCSNIVVVVWVRKRWGIDNLATAGLWPSIRRLGKAVAAGAR